MLVCSFQPARAQTIPQNGLIANVPFTEQSGAVANDITGNGNACTFAAAPNSPGWNGIGIAENGQNSAHSANEYCTFPSTLAPQTRTVAVCAFLPTGLQISSLNGQSEGGGGILSYATLLGAQFRAGLTVWLQTPLLGTERIYYQQSTYYSFGGFGSGTNDMSIGWNCFFYVFGSSSDNPATVDHLYKNGTEVSSYAVQGASAGLLPATGVWYLGGGGWYNQLQFVGTFEHVLAWNRTLSAAEVSSAWQVLQQEMIGRGVVFNPPTSTTTLSVADCVGDSQTNAIPGGVESWCTTDKMTLPPAYNWVLNNNAEGGQTCVAMESDVPAEEALDWSPKAPHSAFMVFCGINDLTIGQESPASIWQRQLGICQLAKQAGYENILDFTLPSWGGEDSQVESLNSLVRSNWTSCFTGVVDLANDPRLGASGAYSNPTYFQQNSPYHLTGVSQALAGGYATNNLASLYGNRASSPRVVNGSSYTMLAGDNYVKATAGAATITLPDCLGYPPGHTRVITNASTGPISAVSQNSEGINGSQSPLSFGAGVQEEFLVQLVSPTAAGCTWNGEAITALALASANAGSKTGGVTSTVLTASMLPEISGVSVTFTDATTNAVVGTAITNNSGTANLAITASTSGIAGGLNSFSASVSAGSTYTAGTSSALLAVYFQGVLFSTTGKHNFSGLTSDGGQEVEGTVDGTPVGPFGVSLFNFTSSSQTITPALTNAASGAFSAVDGCAATLAAGAVCSLNYYYDPPYGDGCELSGTSNICGYDTAPPPGPYQQGTYESATWTVTLPAGVLVGIGDQAFDRSGTAVPSGTLAGKAILAAGSLSVAPLAANFGNVAVGTSQASLTVTVTNSNSSGVPFTYTGPQTRNFSASNECGSSLAGGATCNVYVTMATSSTGTFTDKILITPSGGNTITIMLSGAVLPSNVLLLSSIQHNFGDVTEGTLASFGLNVTNNSSSTATVSFANSPGAGYTSANNCGVSLSAGSSCVYTINFAPASAGAAMDTVQVTSSVPILPEGTTTAPYSDTVTITGTGVTGGELTATSVDHNWGDISVGTNGGNFGVELFNNTSTAISLGLGGGFTSGQHGFSLVSSTCANSLAVNANCELVFDFTPSAAGPVTASYGISASSPLYSQGTGPYTAISLNGDGQ